MALIEETVLSHLRAELENNDIYTSVPKEIPDEFVTIQLIDRGKTNQIYACTFEISSFSTNKLGASTLDKSVRDAMEKITAEETDVSGVELGGGSDAYDTSINKERYLSYYNLTYYE